MPAVINKQAGIYGHSSGVLWDALAPGTLLGALTTLCNPFQERNPQGAAGSTRSLQAGCDLLHFQPQTRMLPDPIFQRFAWAVSPAFANCGEPDFQGRRLRPDRVSPSRAGAAQGG